MSNEWDNFNDYTDEDMSLDDILSEITSSQNWEEDFGTPVKGPIPVSRERLAKPAAAPKRVTKSEKLPPQEKPPKAEKQPKAKKQPKAEKPSNEENPPEEMAPPKEETPKKTEKTEQKVISFPTAEVKEEPDPPAPTEQPKEPGVVMTFLANVLRRADRYAHHMFEEAEPTPEQKKAERYVPGVDQEHTEEVQRPSLSHRRKVRQWPDTPTQELAEQFGRGLNFLRLRRMVVFVLMLPVLYLHLSSAWGLPLPAVFGASLQVWLCVILHGAALALSYDLILSGFTNPGGDTLIVLASFATLADAVTMNFISSREGNLPYSLISMLCLALGLWGRYLKLSSLRTSCRTAQTAKEPYVVTLDEDKWDGRAVFSKWSGPIDGFGSQIQSDDGAMRLLRPVSGLLVLACLLFATISSVGKGRPELFVWCLSCTLCVCASLSSPFAFALPFHFLVRRLSGMGAALAGWEGIRRQGKNSGILLTDTDLFPPGAISMNGVKVFENHPLDKVIAVTATLIRDAGSGLERTFYELLHSQGATYRTAEKLKFYEGGVSAVIRGENVLVGSVSFMHMMEVPITQGQNVKNAVFCAIEGELAGIFALNYSLHVSIRPSLYALIENRISPILATRDFNLVPTMLNQRFKLPAGKMEFPGHDRRRELSAPTQEHHRPLVCVLCREGIAPLAEAVVGARRLNAATRLNVVISVIGSAVGLLLAFYLTSLAAFGSLSVFNMLVFLLMWLVPILLISGWVTRY